MTRLARALTGAILICAASVGIAAPQASEAPSPTATAQVRTTPEGCTYVRAQVPGYPPTWHLVLNPARAGLAQPVANCPHML